MHVTTAASIGRSNHLTVRDLLEIRDAYHVQLSNMNNVIGTAIGLFRWRPGDECGPPLKHGTPRPPRTLSNSVVNESSWPCVLVFVNEWVTRTAFFGSDHRNGNGSARRRRTEPNRYDPSLYVPPYLYLPDGRAARTCIIAVEPAEERSRMERPPAYPSLQLGGGYPLLTRVQGDLRIGTTAAMVTDGRLVYALTAGHVCGSAGQPVESYLGGRAEIVGEAAPGSLRNVLFTQVYPGWPGTHCMSTLDLGLVRIREQSDWTSQVYGLGELEQPLNLTPENIGLELIGLPVRAHGAASRKMVGQVQGLFFRYKSVGGVDYVADVLIGPRDPGQRVMTRPGDSGALWVVEPKDVRTGRWTPFAIQWGGCEYLGASPEANVGFALATFASTACRALEVELISRWNTGLPEYWGKPVHFRLGWFAYGQTKGQLKKLIEANLSSLAWDQMKPDNVGDAFGLIDAPDRWAFGKVRPTDAPNHCVNLDLSDGTMELQQWIKHHPTPQDWEAFYERCGTPADDRGALPFRCGQLFDSLVEYLAAGKLDEAVFAMGALGHYLGDAVMPLHLMTDYKGVAYGTPATESGSTNVHKYYDRMLFERSPEEFTEQVPKALKALKPSPSVELANGRDVARYVVEVMHRAQKHCTQEELLDTYTEWFNSSDQRRDDATAWARIGSKVTLAFAEGVRALAACGAPRGSLPPHNHQPSYPSPPLLTQLLWTGASGTRSSYRPSGYRNFTAF